MALPAWRLNLQPASYNGAGFFVETNARASGRRIANHEFPKRDTPYAEDMGQKSKKFTIAGYVIGSDYVDLRDALIAQLESLGNGQLILPTGMSSDTQNVVVENYSVIEKNDRGGMAEFEITFLDAGINIATLAVANTQAAVS